MADAGTGAGADGGDAARSVGVFTTDRTLVVRSWDGWLERATGVSASDARGRSLVELFPHIGSRGFESRLRRVAEHGTAEVFAPAFHGYFFPCAPAEPSVHFTRMQQHVTAEPLRAGDAIDGVVITIEDVTARLDRERDLAAALASEDAAVRARAEEVLGRNEGAAARMLVDALGDERWRVRRAAAERLAAGAADATAALIAALRERHRDPAALNAALAGLARSAHDVVPALTGLLAAADAELRQYAALALGHLRDRRAVPALVGVLADPETNVRQHAIEALGQIGAAEAAEPLARIAERRDFYLAFAALDALGTIGEPSVAPRLLPLLDDEVLAEAAAGALARIADGRVAEHVAGRVAGLLGRPDADAAALGVSLAALHARLEADAGARRRVEEVVRSAVTAEGGGALVRALGRTSAHDLPSLARVLSWLDIENVEAHLARMLAHDATRHAAADALARRGARAEAALLDALGDPEAEVRKAAASALGQIGTERAIGALIRALDDEPGVVIVAAGALGAIGDQRAYEPLLTLFDHDDAAVRQAAVAALDSIGHPDMPRQIEALLAHPSPRVRESAARVAGYFGYPSCLDAMLALARDGDEVVRRVSVEHLCYFDDPRATQAAAAAIARDPQPAVRAAAARAFAHAPAQAALAPLLAALRDADLWVRYYAARALGSQRLEAAIAPLVALARDDAMPPVRVAAIESLADIRPPDAAAVLLPLTGDTEPDVAAAAQRSLAQLADRATGGPAAGFESDDTGDRAPAR